MVICDAGSKRRSVIPSVDFGMERLVKLPEEQIDSSMLA
jgi:hypothetical protein